MNKLISISIIVFLGVFIAVGGSQIFLGTQVSIQEEVIFEVNKGISLHHLAQKLAKEDIIKNPKIFARMAQVYGYARQIKHGEYLLLPQMSYRNLLEKLSSGDNYKYKLTHVEGDHMYRLAQQLEDLGLGAKSLFMGLFRDKDFIQSQLGEELISLEGYLFPDTYYFAKNDGAEKIVATMIARFKQAIAEIDFSRSAMSRHQVITLASIIEKETGAPFERNTISSVFHNRMKKGMRLQTDPTILYGMLLETGTDVMNIRKKDILRPTPYNTYVINGLPPGPIASPGIEAIKAALEPANTDYLFFVSQNDGTHVFTRNYGEHQKAVRKYQLDPKMREGKSWRDLNKSKSNNRNP
jgi:UPF0755 protein